GPHPHALAAREHLHPPEVPPDVDEEAVALPLAVQARAAAAKCDREAAAPAEIEAGGYIDCAVGHHHGLREEPVRARVGGVADDVDRAAEHAVRPEQRLELSAKRS